MRRRTLTAVLASGALLTACGTDAEQTSDGAAESSSAAQTSVAIATTTPLGSVLAEVVSCAGGEAQTLMSPGDDPHTFAPSSAQVAELASADLVVTNGLGLEEGLAAAVENARSDGAHVLEIAPQVDPIPFDGEAEHSDHGDEAGHSDEEEHDDHDGDHDHDGDDPHFWLDVSRMATAAHLMGTELAEHTGVEAYASCGEQVEAELAEVDAEVREILSAVPAERRTLVTDHHSFGYFAQAYDFDQLGVVIPGGSTEAEPSSHELAALVQTLSSAGVPAIFSNTAVDSPLMEAVASEVGQDVQVVDLYVGSVGPDGSGAETYTEMMLTNARLIADALG